jgi:hypothetical protein
VTSTLTIGDFSRATHLGVKTLRHYHDIGLLEPVDVDADTGYRRYAAHFGESDPPDRSKATPQFGSFRPPVAARHRSGIDGQESPPLSLTSS